jgi:hypothetical protein
MNALELAPLLALLGLGALHGINPAMGWLFAVALGLQEGRARAVWRALPPLALGHALSVAVFAAVATLAGALLSGDGVRWLTALLLLGFAAHRLFRGHRHPRFGGMRVNGADLVIWSFLMASAHGAGLMVLPFLRLGRDAADADAITAGAHAQHALHAGGAPQQAAMDVAAHAAHAAHGSLLAGQSASLTAALVHTVSYLAVTGVIALIVYRQASLRLLRTAWINLDIIWAGALVLTALLILLSLV